jgi:hypothetical protein
MKDVKGNKPYLNKILEEFVKNNDDYRLISAERDRKNSKEISTDILNKIKGSDYFVADISVINPRDVETGVRITSNPNVLYELGFATALDDTINSILVCNEDTVSNIKELPFDIRNRPIIYYPFDSKHLKIISSELSYALKVIQQPGGDILAPIISSVKHFWSTSLLAEQKLNKGLFEDIRGQLSVIQRKQSLEKSFYKRGLINDPALYEAYMRLLDEIKNFDKLTNYIDGGVSHNKQVECLDLINVISTDVMKLLREFDYFTKYKPEDELEDLYSHIDDILTDWEFNNQLKYQMSLIVEKGIDIYVYDYVCNGNENNNLLRIIFLSLQLSWRSMLEEEMKPMVENIRKLAGIEKS